MWSPWQQYLIDNVEMIAARYVCNVYDPTYSVTSLYSMTCPGSLQKFPSLHMFYNLAKIPYHIAKVNYVGGLGLSGGYNFEIFVTDFCSGICRNLSADIFRDADLADGLQFFSVKTKKRSQPAGNPSFQTAQLLQDYNITVSSEYLEVLHHRFSHH